ncbi:MAG: transglutaminase domain-containing protein [Spirochaetales bacterium]|nr:transglutaminase domain-containing protein [Spirochaetales bacterium]
MRRFDLEHYIVRGFIVFCTASIIPLFFKFILRSGIPIWIIGVAVALKVVFESVSARPDLHHTVKQTCSLVSTIASGLLAVATLIVIIITPHSVYAFFFEAASETLTEEYFIANLFVVLAILFSMFVASSAIRRSSYKPLSGLLSVVFFLLLIIFQTPLFVLLLLVSVSLYTALMLKRRAIILAKTILFCIAAGLTLSFLFTTPSGSDLIDRYLYPQTRKLIDTYLPQFPLAIDIPGYEIPGISRRLGGTAVNTSAPIFHITSEQNGAFYIKTDTYDRYTGTGWEQTVKFIENPAPGAGPDVLHPDAENPETLSIITLNEVFLNVPHTIDTIGFDYKNTYYPLPELDYIPGIRFGDGFRRNSLITLFLGRPHEGSNSDTSIFLQTPDTLTREIVNLASSLGNGASSQHDILENILTYLAINNTYNLQAPEVGGGEDFLHLFLFSDKRGYCVHFSTAFIILARLNGIPARYGTGFLAVVSDDSREKTVTARAAHAWPECLLPGRGWEIWEATPILSFDEREALYRNTYYEQYYLRMMRENRIARNSLTLHQLRDLLGIELAPEEKTLKIPEWVRDIVALLPFVLVVMLLVFLSGVLLFILRRIILSRLPSRHLEVLLDKVVRKYKDIPPPEKGGWIVWKKNLHGAYIIEEKNADALLAVILKAAYGNAMPDDQEMSLIKNFIRCRRLVKKS